MKIRSKKVCTKLAIVICCICAGIVVVGIAISNTTRAPSYLYRQTGDFRRDITWKAQGHVPDFEQHARPQGLVFVNGTLLFSNHWNDTGSKVYSINPASLEVQGTFSMPVEATHTSGLAWDGTYLWAVDYRSNTAYQINIEESFASGNAVINGSFDTTLSGTSACTILEVENTILLAISDYQKSMHTIFVDVAVALKSGTAADAIRGQYTNDGYSQGLAFFEGQLYESENKLGKDVINVYNVEALLTGTDASEALEIQYSFSANNIEDLAWDGTSLWTSDEGTYNFYSTELN